MKRAIIAALLLAGLSIAAATDYMRVSGVFQLLPVTFVNLATCNAGAEGQLRAVNDGSTNVWGANLTGGGANHVLAYCDGSNWTVAGK